MHEELADMVRHRLIEGVIKGLIESGEFDRAIDSIVEGKVDPYTACDKLVLPRLSNPSGN